MKKLLITALLMIGMTSIAQEAPKQSKSGRAATEKLTPEQRQQLHLKKLILDLNLNESQQKEFAALIKESHVKREAAKEERREKYEKGEKLSKDERFALKSKMLDEQIATKGKVRKILSPEQFTKWEQLQHDRKKEFRNAHKRHDSGRKESNKR